MTNDRGDVLVALAARLDPEREVPPTLAEQVAAQRLLESLVDPSREAASRHRRRPAPRRVAGLVGLTALVTAAFVVGGVVPRGGVMTTVATADTPPLLEYSDADGAPAASTLVAVADAADSMPAEAPRSGSFRYNHTRAWSLRLGYDEPLEGRLGEVDRTLWLADDGSGRSLTVEDGVSRTVDSPAGTFPTVGSRPRLDGEPEAVLRELTSTGAATTAHQLMEAYVEVVRLTGQQPAASRASVLRALATADVVTYGSVTDREGRRAVAFGASRERDGVRDELRILVDPQTGEVLAAETTWHGPRLLGSTSAVVDYVSFVGSGWSDERPPCGREGCIVATTPG